MPNPSSPTKTAPRGLHLTLWLAQGLLALTFVGAGLWKLVTPVTVLASKMPWMGQVSPAFLRATAVADLLAGLGVLLPSVARRKPRLVALGALGGLALMLGAIVFHVRRGEAADTPFNFFVAALAAFVAWGRSRRAPLG